MKTDQEGDPVLNKEGDPEFSDARLSMLLRKDTSAIQEITKKEVDSAVFAFMSQ